MTPRSCDFKLQDRSSEVIVIFSKTTRIKHGLNSYNIYSNIW